MILFCTTDCYRRELPWPVALVRYLMQSVFRGTQRLSQAWLRSSKTGIPSVAVSTRPPLYQRVPPWWAQWTLGLIACDIFMTCVLLPGPLLVDYNDSSQAAQRSTLLGIVGRYLSQTRRRSRLKMVKYPRHRQLQITLYLDRCGSD